MNAEPPEGSVFYLTHAEVEIDPDMPVPQWGLNAIGKRRHAAFAARAALDRVSAVYSSTERKAVQGATPVAERLGLPVQQRAALGENDRSATGYLAENEFWPVVERFFAEPETSVRGWETAHAAQRRVVAAVSEALAETPAGDVLIVGHGGVGTLLWCHLADCPIDRSKGPTHPGGGCWFGFHRAIQDVPTSWTAI